MLAKLWVALYRYHTQEVVYLAECAKLSLWFDLSPGGFDLEVTGKNKLTIFKL
jgi:hypothetical protein